MLNSEYCNNIEQKQLCIPPLKHVSDNQMQRDQQPNCKASEKANLKKGLETKIEQGNKGFDLLLKMGYQEGQGLGKDGAGIMEPVGIATKTDRKGLGTEDSSKLADKQQICQAPTKRSRKRRRRARRRRRQPIDVIIAKQEAQKAREQADKAMRAADKALQAAERAIKVADNMKAASRDLMEVEDNSKKQHSHIQAPTPKSLPRPAIKTSAPNVTQKQGNVVKPFFSINDPCTPQFLRSISRCFHSEIELMQLRLKAAASLIPVHADNELIVAKILIGHNQTVAGHDFEFIRNDLVGWIGTYQEEGLDTPIFHSMTNNDSHITVICDNGYAYNCLHQCIVDISIMETMGTLKVFRLPPITPLIYCVDAVYEGVARDSTLFLTQIHLHKSKLYSDNWIVVSHEVCPDERKTYFIFLIDERSALALNYHYSSTMFICLQNLTFRYRGIVSED